MRFLPSKKDDFSHSGPKHLTAETVDWTNADHRRSVVACLVQGVYVMERDRQKKRKVSKELAPPWWESFDVKMLDRLTDGADIFGAIYEFIQPPPSNGNLPTDGIPCYVIAFRGTLIKLLSLKRDMKSNVHIILNDLHRIPRLETAVKAVSKWVAEKGSSNVWLAGHSLGAAIALVAGKIMAKNGVFLQSFLFNPPFLSAPIERIQDEKVKHGLRMLSSMITAVLALVMNHNNQSADPFRALSEWVPCLYVNQADDLCSEYIAYFEHRKTMERKAGCLAKIATRHSLGCLLMIAMGKESKPIHLLPSANLMINSTLSNGLGQPHGIREWWRLFKQGHGIKQWWSPGLPLESKHYT